MPALKRAVDNGVKLVDYNTTIDSPIMTTFVGVDNTELGAQTGRYIADYVKDKMGGNAKIALITIPSTRLADNDGKVLLKKSQRFRVSR